jgi:hypothetical protein
MKITILSLALTAWCQLGGMAAADVLVTVQPPFSDPPFAITPSYTVSYLPANGIDLTEPSGFPQPNTDVEDDNKFGVSPNYGGTGYTALTSRHVFENSPEIALTVGGLNDSQPYQVFVQSFVNTGSDFYGGRYGFASGQLTSYFYSSGGTLIATGVNGPDQQGQFQIREFNLGTHSSAGGQFAFYFDDFNGASLVGDFIALRLAPVPEPSAAVLACLAVVGFAAVAALKRPAASFSAARRPLVHQPRGS